jgi:hypothetical protein
MDSSSSGQGELMGPFDHGNKPSSASIKGGKFLDKLRVLSVYQEGLCSMEFLIINICASTLLNIITQIQIS